MGNTAKIIFGLVDGGGVSSAYPVIQAKRIVFDLLSDVG